MWTRLHSPVSPPLCLQAPRCLRGSLFWNMNSLSPLKLVYNGGLWQILNVLCLHQPQEWLMRKGESSVDTLNFINCTPSFVFSRRKIKKEIIFKIWLIYFKTLLFSGSRSVVFHFFSIITSKLPKISPVIAYDTCVHRRNTDGFDRGPPPSLHLQLFGPLLIVLFIYLFFPIVNLFSSQ